MLDPLCKICGERHRSGPCPQNFKKPAKSKSAEDVAEDDAHRAMVRFNADAGNLKRHTESSRTPPVQKPKFDKVKYQREYMQKRRAQKKPA
jgi:hypothetical protein